MDLQYLLLLQHLREDVLGGAFNDFALQISDLSYGIFIWLYACIFFWALDKKTGSLLFLNVGLGRFLMQTLKLTFCVYRPWIRSTEILPIEYPSGYSFPSGHSVTSTANFGTLARQYYKKCRPLAVFLLFCAALTIFSRNFIGAHTPQDVAVGGVMCMLVVIFASRLWEWVDADPRREVLIPVAGGVLVLILWEKTVIPAAVHAIGSNWGYFFMMGSEFIVLLAVYPWLFQKWERSAKQPLRTAA